jgi:hypothetical protein
MEVREPGPVGSRDRGDGSPAYDAALVYTLSAVGIARMDFVRALAT